MPWDLRADGLARRAGALIPDRARALLRGERGAVSAEFAIVLPAVLVVLGLVIGGIAISAHRIALASAAAEVARLEARGGGAEAEERLAVLGPEIVVRRQSEGALHCVSLTAHPGSGPFRGIAVSERACAAISDAGVEP